MPRYVVERTFPDGLDVAASPDVSKDDKTTFCVYDAPSPEAIRKAATRNKLPVDRITQVRVLDPYFAG